MLTKSIPTSLIEKFFRIFPGNESAITLGYPTDQKKPNGKQIWKYATERRGMSPRDVIAHLRGEISIVQIPIRQDSTCSFGVGDVDIYAKTENQFRARCYERVGQGLYAFPSKSGGFHIFLLLSEPRPAHLVRRHMRQIMTNFGHPQAEIFPKQDQLTNATQCGNGINLPFFGKFAEFEQFQPNLYRESPRHWTLAPIEAPVTSCINEEDEGETGYWSPEALLALLQTFSEKIPNFVFRRCRQGFAVPCPGNVTSWPDGARHSTDDPLLSHETLVWLRNSWPVFRCVHAHCDGGAGAPKKTWLDFIEYYDPQRLLFDFDAWLDAEMEKCIDEVYGSTTSSTNVSRPAAAQIGEDFER